MVLWLDALWSVGKDDGSIMIQNIRNLIVVSKVSCSFIARDRALAMEWDAMASGPAIYTYRALRVLVNDYR